MAQIPNTLDGELLRRKLRNDYGAYVEYSNPGFYMTKFHRYLCDEIQKFLEHTSDNAMDILLLSVPPRHGKSYTLTETLPSWFLGKNPDCNVIICGYEGTFAESFSRRNRDKFNEYACDVFRVEANDKVQGVALWETKAGGRCRAAGLKGGITGYGAELFIIDDPIKNREAAESEAILAKIHDEMGPSVQSRIHPGGKLIVIQTRWVENDVIGYIEKNWSEFIYKTINLPCECEDPENDPLGRRLGDALMGEHLGDYDIPQRIRNDNKWLKSKKILVCAGEGEHVWNALYQGHPSAQNGNLFKDDWWQYYSRRDIKITDFEFTCLSIDATFKKTETSDMVALELWGLRQNHCYLYKLINKRMGFVETCQFIRKLVKDYPQIDELIIEDKANGSAIIDTLRYTDQDNMPAIVPVNPLGGKYSRAQAVSPFVSTRCVHIPNDFTEEESKDIEWDGNEVLPPHMRFTAQHSRFPFMKHDDMVDSTSQALSRLIKLITGEESIPERKYLRYTKWYPDMWEDFEQMNEMEQEQFIRTYGAPLEWQDI
jgi:predicted phage terminase large subunit-like protein